MKFLLFPGSRARRVAEEFCRTVYPGEPVFGSAVCAREVERFVVRVFYGRPTETVGRIPPASGGCAIIAVGRRDWTPELVDDDRPYRPIRR